MFVAGQECSPPDRNVRRRRVSIFTFSRSFLYIFFVCSSPDRNVRRRTGMFVAGGFRSSRFPEAFCIYFRVVFVAGGSVHRRRVMFVAGGDARGGNARGNARAPPHGGAGRVEPLPQILQILRFRRASPLPPAPPKSDPKVISFQT